MSSQRNLKDLKQEEWLPLPKFRAAVAEQLHRDFEVTTFYKFVQEKMPKRKVGGLLQFPLHAGIEWIVKNKIKE